MPETIPNTTEFKRHKLTDGIRRTIFIALKQLQSERTIKRDVARGNYKDYPQGSPEALCVQPELQQLENQIIEVIKAIDWFKRQ